MNKFYMDDIYINMFLEETKEQIEKMEEDFLELENGNVNSEIINRIFRMAHSIKGAAATMGYETMSELSHNLESLLDKIREEKVVINDEIMDIFLKGVDALKNMHQAISHGEEVNIDISSLKNDISKILSSENCSINKSCIEELIIKKQEFSENELMLTEEESLICSEIDSKKHIYKIKIVMKKDTVMKSVKGFLIVNNLSGIGHIIKSEPEDFENISDCNYDGSVYILIATDKEYDTIYKNINDISEIDKIYINKVIEGRETKELKELPNMKIINKDVEFHREEPVTIRVDVSKIDKLINLIGEFIIDKEGLMELTQKLKLSYKNEQNISSLSNLVSHINFISGELQETVMSTRMLPLENIFNRFPRMVRDLSKKCDKKIDFIIKGKETEIDRGIIEELIDPLTHIIRNAIDHGLETEEERKAKGKNSVGTIVLSARHMENNVVIEVQEDGRGIDVNKIKDKVIKNQLATEEELKNMQPKDIINFIFEPGFSTAEKVSDISGRGVGLDVVKSNIGKLNGIIDIESEIHKGTKFTIKLPLTLAIVQALIIKENEYNFAIPITSIIEIIRLKDTEILDDIHNVKGVQVYKWREQVIPVINIKDYFSINIKDSYFISSKNNDNKMFLVVVGYSEKKAALVVEKLIGEREIVIKSMADFIGEDKIMGQIEGISGVSILRDGSFAQIIDVASVIKR